MLKNRNIGDDISIMNTSYIRQYKDESTGKWKDDSITIVYKDNVTDKKHHETIYKPDYIYYEIKEEYIKDHPQFFVEKDKVITHITPYTEIEKDIASVTNNLDFFKQNIANGNRGENRKLHTHPAILFSDVNIEDHYRFRFNNLYTNNIKKVKKGYFDIEVDGKYQKGEFPEPGEVPINAVSYLDEKTKKIYSWILRNPENPQIQEFEDGLGPELFKELHDFITEKVGGPKKAKIFGLDKYSNEFFFFDDEISLLNHIFETLNTIDPDFILIWNMGFDLPYIIERIKNLGYDPRDIMCNKEFKEKIVKYYVDERNEMNLAERGDYVNISSNIVYIDQMIQFASRRKSKIGSIPNFKLDTIGESVAKVSKLDYSHITRDITKLAYLSFKTFMFYGIMDVVVQKCIEVRNQDIDYIYAKCLVNNTIYQKGHRQTVYLINRIAKEFYNDGYILGNNNNRWNEKGKKFPGALVGNPVNNSDYCKFIINGKPVNIMKNAVDYDYKALYPSIDLEFNIAPNTLIGAVKFPNKVYDNENYWKCDEEHLLLTREGEFIDNMVCDNHIEFSKRYFKLAGITDYLKDLDEYSKVNYMVNPLTKEAFTRMDSSVPIFFYSDYQSVNTTALYFEPEAINYKFYSDKIKETTLR